MSFPDAEMNILLKLMLTCAMAEQNDNSFLIYVESFMDQVAR